MLGASGASLSRRSAGPGEMCVASRPFSGGEVTSEERLPGPLAEESVSAVSRPTAEEVRDSSERQHDDPADDGEKRE